MRSVRQLLTICLLFGVAISSHGALVAYQATGVFTRSDFTNEIAVGDHFLVSFGYNDGVTDIDTRTLAGRFPGAVAFFDIRLVPGSSTGSYAGGVGTSFWPVDTFDGIGSGPTSIPDRFYLSVLGGTFGNLGGHGFAGLLFVLDDYTHTSAILDTGGGQTLASLLRGPLNLSQFTNTTLRISATNKTGSAEGYVASLMVLSNFPPRLEINSTGIKEVELRWNTNDLGCTLETTLALPSASWQAVTNNAVIIGEQYVVALGAAEPRRYFRLRKN
jgi:hypothetical protein